MGGWQTVRLANPIFSAVSNSSSNGGDASRVGKITQNVGSQIALTKVSDLAKAG